MRYVYHFTDSARLPYIFKDGELRPGLNRVGNYPTDFLWGTTNDKGSRTAAGAGGRRARDAYRRGMLRLVRFTFRAEAFEVWPDVLAKYPAWTEAHRKQLENDARALGDSDIAVWRCRSDPLPIDEAVKIETRTYTGRWEEMKERKLYYFDENGAVGFKLGGFVYPSLQVFDAKGRRGYELFDPLPADGLQGQELAA